MKQIKFITTALICGTIALSSCDKQNGDGYIDNAVYEAFDREFPGAKDVSWRTNGNYAIASFEWNGSRAGNDTDFTAWFEKSTATFKMHEYDIPFSSLPQAVTTAFNESDYSKLPWRHDDEVDVIKKHDENLVLYVIEVEKEENNKETEADLYYSENGVLVKEVLDANQNPDYTDLLPTQPANNAYSWVESKYPGARIVDVEFEDGGVEVEFIDYYIDDIEYYETNSKGNFFSVEIEGRYDDDIELYFNENGNAMNSKPNFGDDINGGISAGTAIQAVLNERYPGAVIKEKGHDDGLTEIEIIHDGIEKDVYFNGKDEWVRTEYETTYNNLPEAVKNYISANYTSHENEADAVETPAGNWFEIEARKGGAEYDVLINKDGTLKAEYKD